MSFNWRTLYKRVVFHFCHRFELDGFKVSVFVTTPPNTAIIRNKLTQALALIRDYDPIRYAYMRRDVKRLLVLGSVECVGRWDNDLSMCELTYHSVLEEETTPAMVAATVVHEAMHARLFRWGIGYEEEKRERVEKICFKAEIAFAHRLPSSQMEEREYIIEEANRQIQRDPADWTDEGRLNASLDAVDRFKELHAPEWLTKLLRRWIEAKIRRESRNKE